MVHLPEPMSLYLSLTPQVISLLHTTCIMALVFFSKGHRTSGIRRLFTCAHAGWQQAAMLALSISSWSLMQRHQDIMQQNLSGSSPGGITTNSLGSTKFMTTCASPCNTFCVEQLHTLESQIMHALCQRLKKALAVIQMIHTGSVQD